MICLILGALNKEDYEEIGRLVLKTQTGDEGAWVKLVDILKDPIYRYCYYHLWDKILAEDAAEEALVKTFEKIKQIRKPEAFFMYVLRTSGNVCIDMKKDVSRFVSLPDGFDVPDPASESPHPVVNEASKKHREIINSALDNLGDMGKQVVMLKVIENMKHKEIADTLGISEVNSKVVFKRSVDKLRTMHRLKDLYKSVSGGD
jgi:RNA polymerase sigma-70 factor, ECF subfamily